MVFLQGRRGGPGACSAGRLGFLLPQQLLEGGPVLGGQPLVLQHLNQETWCPAQADPGQEVIARITNLGHPARVLIRLSFAGEHPIAAGSRLFIDGDDAGQITSSITWPGLERTEALGYVAWAWRNAPGVTIRGAGGEFPATARLMLKGFEYGRRKA